MAYFSGSLTYLDRISDLLSLTATARTSMCWVRNRSTIPSGGYNTAYTGGDALPPIDSEGGLFTTDTQKPQQYLQKPGGFFNDVTDGIISPGTWTHYAWTKNGTTHKFYVNGVIVGTSYIFDMTTAVTAIELIGGDGLSFGDLDVVYYRAWTAELTLAEIKVEAASAVVIKTASLFQNTPLVLNGLDLSGNSRNWTNNGAAYQPTSIPALINNGDASTATVITSLPFTETLKSSPLSGLNPDVWYKYTAVNGDIVLGLWPFTGVGASKQPYPTIYTGTPSALVAYTDSIDLWPIGRNSSYSVPVTAGTTYYIRISDAGVDVTGVPNFVFSAVAGPRQTSSVGDLLVWDETFGFPLIVLKQDTGEVLQHYKFSAGEAGDIQTDGTILAEAIDFLASPIGLQLWNANLTLNQTIVYPSNFNGAVFSIRKSYLGGWFVSTKGDGVNGHVVKVDSTGTIISTNTPPYNNTNTVGIAPSPNDGILYYAITGVAGNPVKRWDLVNNIALSDLAAGVATYQVQQDILVLSDGTILVQYAKISATRDNFVRHYATDGTILNTYNFGSSVLLNRGARGLDDLTSFWVWLFPQPNTNPVLNIYKEIRVSDGVVLNTVTKTQFERGFYQSAATATPTDRFGPSFSCPFVIAPLALTPPFPPTPPAGSGTIQVVKVTVPSSSQLFSFIAGGGLSPTSFSLANGGVQLFLNLAVKSGYSISENAVAGYVTTYSVSNSSPINNISVGNGEVVVVTFTNTLSAIGGIYKVVPGKRNDTLWLTFSPQTTQDVKIPDPSIRTALIGE